MKEPRVASDVERATNKEKRSLMNRTTEEGKFPSMSLSASRPSMSCLSYTPHFHVSFRLALLGKLQFDIAYAPGEDLPIQTSFSPERRRIITTASRDEIATGVPFGPFVVTGN
ncbi:unnamed protein product, partial [Nesidiocoris tenuis]